MEAQAAVAKRNRVSTHPAASNASKTVHHIYHSTTSPRIDLGLGNLTKGTKFHYRRFLWKDPTLGPRVLREWSVLRPDMECEYKASEVARKFNMAVQLQRGTMCSEAQCSWL